jgi:hypothetical protein
MTLSAPPVEEPIRCIVLGWACAFVMPSLAHAPGKIPRPPRNPKAPASVGPAGRTEIPVDGDEAGGRGIGGAVERDGPASSHLVGLIAAAGARFETTRRATL